MEQQTIEAASTSEAVNFITYVQGLKRKMKSWEKQVNLYREGQRILERQRFQFPSAWLHVDNIEVHLSDFLLSRKDIVPKHCTDPGLFFVYFHFFVHYPNIMRKYSINSIMSKQSVDGVFVIRTHGCRIDGNMRLPRKRILLGLV